MVNGHRGEQSRNCMSGGVMLLVGVVVSCSEDFQNVFLPFHELTKRTKNLQACGIEATSQFMSVAEHEPCRYGLVFLTQNNRSVYHRSCTRRQPKRRIRTQDGHCHISSCVPDRGGRPSPPVFADISARWQKAAGGGELGRCFHVVVSSTWEQQDYRCEEKAH